MWQSGSMTPWRIPWIVIAMLSMLACADAIALHLAQLDELAFTHVCTIAPGFDCAPALESHYSRLFSIPLSSYALATYLLFALMAVQSLFVPVRRDRNALVLALATSAATVFTSWLAWVSSHRLRAYCPLCLLLHVITPFLAIASIAALSNREQTLRRIIIAEFASIAESRILTVGVIIVPLLLVVGLPLYSRRAHERMLDADPQYRDLLAGKFHRYEPLHEEVKDAPAIGRADAPVEIVEFADFTCPVCAESRYLLEDLARVYDIRIVYMNHPKSRECNPWSLSDHPGACTAALVAVAAHRRGDFWSVHDALFDQIGELTPGNADVFARIAGASSMKDILADTANAMELAREIAIGHAAGVTHTPTIFINGMGVQGMPDRWFLEEAIENELDRVGRR